MSTNRTTLEQGRAAFAYTCAEEANSCYTDKKSLKSYRDDWYKSGNYSSYVKKLPMLIKTNGLGAALAFIRSKGAKPKSVDNVMRGPGHEKNPKNAYDLVYEQIGRWIKEEKFYMLNPNTRNEDFTKQVLNMGSSDYRALSVEVLALLNWMKRFSVALLGEGDNND